MKMEYSDQDYILAPIMKLALAPEHSEQTKLGGGGQAIDHKQCLPPPQTFVSSERSGASECLSDLLQNYCKVCRKSSKFEVRPFFLFVLLFLLVR